MGIQAAQRVDRKKIRGPSRPLTHGVGSPHPVEEDVIVASLNSVRACGARRRIAAAGLGWAQMFERLTADLGESLWPVEHGVAGFRAGMGAELRLVSQGQRNVLEGIRYLQAALGALDEAEGLLIRIADLVTQLGANLPEADLEKEIQRLLASLDLLGRRAEFNGTRLFASRVVVLPVEGFPSIELAVGTLEDVFGLGSSVGSLATAETTRAAQTVLGEALGKVRKTKAALQGTWQQLTKVFSILGTQVENLSAAYGWARDPHVTEEVVNLVKFELLNQAGITALSQIQPASREVLAILQRFQVPA